MKKLEKSELNNTILEVYFTEDGIKYMQEVEVIDEKLKASIVDCNFNDEYEIFKVFGFDFIDAVNIASSMRDKHLSLLFFKGKPMIL